MFSPGMLRTSLENRVFLSVVGLLAGGAALWMTVHFSQRNVSADEGLVSAGESPRMDKEEGVALPEGFASRAVDFCAGEVRLDRSFVVFGNGTCVLVGEPADDPLADALGVLKEAAKPGAVFATATGTDGSVMVTYREKLFQRFTADEVESLGDSLEDHFRELMTPAEIAARDEGMEISAATKIGLLGRRCLMRDAEEKSAVRIVRERRNHPVSAR